MLLANQYMQPCYSCCWVGTHMQTAQGCYASCCPAEGCASGHAQPFPHLPFCVMCETGSLRQGTCGTLGLYLLLHAASCTCTLPVLPFWCAVPLVSGHPHHEEWHPAGNAADQHVWWRGRRGPGTGNHGAAAQAAQGEARVIAAAVVNQSAGDPQNNGPCHMSREGYHGGWFITSASGSELAQ
jgi:hypothetical protein